VGTIPRGQPGFRRGLKTDSFKRKECIALRCGRAGNVKTYAVLTGGTRQDQKKQLHDLSRRDSNGTGFRTILTFLLNLDAAARPRCAIFDLPPTGDKGQTQACRISLLPAHPRQALHEHVISLAVQGERARGRAGKRAGGRTGGKGRETLGVEVLDIALPLTPVAHRGRVHQGELHDVGGLHATKDCLWGRRGRGGWRRVMLPSREAGPVTLAQKTSKSNPSADPTWLLSPSPSILPILPVPRPLPLASGGRAQRPLRCSSLPS